MSPEVTLGSGWFSSQSRAVKQCQAVGIAKSTDGLMSDPSEFESYSTTNCMTVQSHNLLDPQYLITFTTYIGGEDYVKKEYESKGFWSRR